MTTRGAFDIVGPNYSLRSASRYQPPQHPRRHRHLLHPHAELARDDGRVDEAAAVVADPVAVDAHLERVGIDLGEGDVGAARVRDVGWLEVVRDLEPGRHAARGRGDRGGGREAAQLYKTLG